MPSWMCRPPSVEFACSIGSAPLLQRIVAGYEKLPETSVWRDPLFRQTQFSARMKAACKAGHLAAAQWLQSMAGRKKCNGRALIIPAAAAGNLEMVKWA